MSPALLIPSRKNDAVVEDLIQIMTRNITSAPSAVLPLILKHHSHPYWPGGRSWRPAGRHSR